ncbi:MAG: vitamin B12 dependent-methionine synthase activation domain-containing protein, partial [Rivularia sp. (in: cyanobacteria)]
GAALTPKFVNEDCQNTYQGKVEYGKDAVSDLNFMEKLMPAKAGNNWDDFKGFQGEFAEPEPSQNGHKAQEEESTKEKVAEEPKVIDTKRSEAVEIDTERPKPPFWGTKLLQPEDIPIEELFWYLDLQALIAGQWQFRKPKGQTKEEYQVFLQEKVYPILEKWKKRVVEENLLHPQVIYGYFPTQAQGNTLHIYNPENHSQEVAELEFPRQKSMRRLCIADFFAPKETGHIDVFPMQAVTVGEVATEFAQKLFSNNEYTDYLYFHGIAVQMAEALAEWTHARIRRELGFAAEDPDNIRDTLAQRYRGSRYSFGYPACPNIQDQYKQLELLKTDRINLYMDESEQIYPEQSTTAIITYHPAAKYFSA